MFYIFKYFKLDIYIALPSRLHNVKFLWLSNEARHTDGADQRQHLKSIQEYLRWHYVQRAFSLITKNVSLLHFSCIYFFLQWNCPLSPIFAIKLFLFIDLLLIHVNRIDTCQRGQYAMPTFESIVSSSYLGACEYLNGTASTSGDFSCVKEREKRRPRDRNRRFSRLRFRGTKRSRWQRRARFAWGS